MNLSMALGLSDALGLDRLPVEVRSNTRFVRSLANAQRWSELKALVSEPIWSLRTAALRPKLILGDVFPAFSWDYNADVLANLDLLSAGRTSLLEQDRSAVATSAVQAKGRVLVFYFHETLSCGGAWQITSGYFDDWNMPPWDTWIASAFLKYGECLLSWVPETFVQTVSAGIWANPEECLSWLRPDHQKHARNTRPASVGWPTRHLN